MLLNRSALTADAIAKGLRSTSVLKRLCPELYPRVTIDGDVWPESLEAIKQGSKRVELALSDKGTTELMVALLYQPDLVPALVDARADVNAVTSYGCTPLHFAVYE